MHAPSLFHELRRIFAKAPPSLSRRAFLSASAAVGAALLLSQGRRYMQKPPPRVVIVGAGFAGLSCAYELAAAGVSPVVLEARDRVGGRVHTVQHPGVGAHAEAGGEFVGRQHHVWGAYAQRFGLPLVSSYEPTAADAGFVVDGKPMSQDAALGLYHEMCEVFARIGQDARRVDPGRPWASANAALWDHTSVAQVLDAMGLSPLCSRMLHGHFANESAMATSHQSYLGLLAAVQGGDNEDYWTHTEALRCASGNQRLAEALAAALPREALKLRHPVRSIVRDGAGMVVTGDDGTAYACDICVLAVPPSAWGRISFEPGLPADLRPQMGPAIKHFVWLDRVQPPTGPTLMMSDYFGTLYPMLHTGPGSAGEMLFSSADSAARYRALSPSARAAQRAKMPCQDAAHPPGSIAASQFIDWPAETFTGAGYSCQGLGEVTRCGPIWDAGIGPLQFIGEHTHYAFVGFMEGALRSGAHMAARIVARGINL